MPLTLNLPPMVSSGEFLPFFSQKVDKAVRVTDDAIPDPMIRPLDPPDSDLPARIKAAFQPGGLIARVRNFEPRPQQVTMAVAVATALCEERHLMVEAGTGVGKSLAYLLPALHFAHEHQKKAVVSTYTIHLQQQLLQKDIALLERLLPFEFEAALFKGRQNYLCPRRLQRALAQADDLFLSPEKAELERLAEWLKKTKDGTLFDLDPQPDPKVWAHVCSEAHVCTAKTCGHDPRCFYQQARRKLQSADLVVINHSLLFTYLQSQDPDDESARTGYLFDNDFLILDEAHNLESVAANHIGLSFTSGQLAFLLQRLFHPKTGKGLIRPLHLPALEKSVLHLFEEAETFFLRLAAACSFNKGHVCRVTQPDLVEDTLSLPMLNLRQELLDAAANLDDETTQAELRDAARRLAAFRNNLVQFLAQNLDESVYWITCSGKSQSTLELRSAPVDLSGPLRQLLFGPGRSAILTSATFSVGSGLDYVQHRIGADQAETLQLDSPFDYARQMKVFIPDKIPEPNSEGHQAALHAWIRFFLDRSHGSALVLFTSYDSLKQAFTAISPWAAARQITLLAQGHGSSPAALIQTFKQDIRSVLLGTDSFWQGVDVPGESLSNVIITRLPFPVPDHPLIEAKIEAIEAQGGNAFQEFSLPEAILKFRQGVGRLIRTRSDTGSVAILDGRIRTKSYGRSFLQKLPKCPIEIIAGTLGPDGEIHVGPSQACQPN